MEESETEEGRVNRIKREHYRLPPSLSLDVLLRLLNDGIQSASFCGVVEKKGE